MYWESTPRADDPSVADLHLSKAACVGPTDVQYIMGGIGLGAGIYAMEQMTGHPILWASVQFLGTAHVGADVTIRTELLHNGRRAKHARATLYSGDKPIHVVSGSLACLETPDAETYFTKPEVTPPEAGTPWDVNLNPVSDNLISRIDIRDAGSNPETGVGYLWFRSNDGLPMSASWLAVLADFMPAPHPATNKCTSLDNVLRVHKLVESEWVLGECRVSEHRNGYFHGDINLFAQDGTLLATGNQTGLRWGT